jgi:outer membrane protein TolC
MKLARQLLLFTIVTGVCAGLPSRARAQATARGSVDVELSNEDALVRYALSHSPGLRSARWQQDIANAGVTSASALANPIARGEWLHVQAPSEYGWGVGIEWAPPRPGVYGRGKDAARAELRAVKADFNELAAELEATVRGSYAQIGTLDAELSLAEKSLDTRRAVHQAINDRVAHGASSRIDLSLAAVSLARGEQQRDLLALARASEVLHLEGVLGLPADQSLAVKPGAVANDPLAPASGGPGALGVDSLEHPAHRQRPQLEADAARRDAADLVLSAEQAKRWPWLSLQARYRQHDQATYHHDVTLGVELTLPIFDRNPGPIAAAEAKRRELRDVLSGHRLNIERDVRALRAESARRREIAEHYAQTIAPILSEHAALVKQAMAGLELDVTALLAAEDLVTQGGIEYLEARLSQRKSEIALARALGEYGLAGAK